MESKSFSSLVILTFCLILLEKFKNAWKEEKDVYKMLKDVIDNVLSTSGYSEVNLAKLFQAFTALKYWPTVLKWTWVIRYGIIFMPILPPRETIQCYVFIF